MAAALFFRYSPLAFPLRRLRLELFYRAFWVVFYLTD